MKHFFTSLLLIIFISTFTYSQRWNSKYKYDFFYGLGVSNFMGDVMSPSNKEKYVWCHFFNTMGSLANVGLRYNFKTRQHLTGVASLGQLYAKETPGNSKYYYRGLKFSTVFLELYARYEFTIIQERKRRTIYRKLGETKWKNFSIPTYLFIGAGGLINGGTVTHRYDITALKKQYINFAPVIPYGIGVKTKLQKRLYLNIEAGARFTFSDGIDYIKKNNFSTIAGGNYIDQYGFITVNIIQHLGVTRKGLPKFKRR